MESAGRWFEDYARRRRLNLLPEQDDDDEQVDDDEEEAESGLSRIYSLYFHSHYGCLSQTPRRIARMIQMNM